MNSYTEVKYCRMCLSEKLELVFSLGEQFVVDFVKDPKESLFKAPLKLVRCGGCGLVQLQHSVDRERLYRKFWYKSSTQEAMRSALENIVASAVEVSGLKEGDRVLDIGANDGQLLGWYNGNIRTVGIDPCKELIEDGLKNRRMDVGIKDFFSRRAVEPYGPYKVITAIAMFYDLENPVAFLRECAGVLRSDGVIIVQMNYLGTMLSNFAIDNVCHEHLTYFTMTTMKDCAERAGLEVVGAVVNDVNGGSFRVYLTHKGCGLTTSTDLQLRLFSRMTGMLYEEMKCNFGDAATYAAFGGAVEEKFQALTAYLVNETAKGEKIYVCGASTRGTVLLQLLQLPDGVLRGVGERDKSKIGLRMVGGSWPEIFHEDYVRKEATQMLLLPWHFKDSIYERELEWLKSGGKLIVPLPEPIVLDWKGVGRKIREMYVETPQ